MPLNIPTTLQIIEQNIANIENRINQTTPIVDKAFTRVLSTMEGMLFTLLYKFGVERAKQNLVITATDEDLDALGLEYGVTRKPAEAAKLEVQLTGTNGVVIPAGTEFTADSTGERYTSDTTETIAGGVATFNVTAATAGTVGNINNGETLSIVSPIAGADTTATVTKGADDPDVPNLGVDRETDEAYRRRILLEIQTVGGGGNGVDHRTWAEEVAGVFRAFPYAGAPLQTVAAFKDGDMEKSDVSDWSAALGAVLTKDLSSPHSGLRCLRVAWGGTATPFAYQTSLIPGTKYRITGWMRGDGTYNPAILNTELPFQGIYISYGTPSSTWQYFDEEFIAVFTDISFMSLATAAGFCEFDDIDIIQTSLPGDRTVFVEADSSIDPDGIAPQSMLDDVRASINADPDTGISRPPLGLTDETLIVESITRRSIFVEVRGLVVNASVEALVKFLIGLAVDDYLRDIAPFIEGTDPPTTKQDTITDLTLSRVVQDILDPYDGSAAGIGFGLSAGNFISSYTLGMGELAKSGGVTYA